MLQLIAERFTPGEDYSPSVRRRKDAGIGSVSAVLDANAPPRPIPSVPATSITASVTLSTAPANPILTGSQTAFATAAQGMLDKHGKDAKDAYPELAHLAATR
jgi:phospholipase C